MDKNIIKEFRRGKIVNLTTRKQNRNNENQEHIKHNINNDKRAETKNKNTQTDTTNENIQIHQKENIEKQLKLEKEHYKKLFENAEKKITKLKEEISEHKLQRNLLENQVNLMDWNVVDDIDFEDIKNEELNFEW